MTFYTKPIRVEAQQYTDANHPEWVTLVKLISHEVPKGAAIFYDDGGYVRVVVPGDWIVKWPHGFFDIISDTDFAYRFTTEDHHGTLKESLDGLARRKADAND